MKEFSISEMLVAANLIRTVTSSLAIDDILILGITVRFLTTLSMWIQIEFEGALV